MKDTESKSQDQMHVEYEYETKVRNVQHITSQLPFLHPVYFSVETEGETKYIHVHFYL